jgi:pSer/pThr/pTyr-binding forkhead associated (FHA) protein
MKVDLISLDAWTPSFEIALDRGPVLLGRAASAAVQLDDRFVSRYHCQIDQISGTLWVRDLGSLHGTFVNGLHVTQSHLLPGDRLTVGMTAFRLQYERQRSTTVVDWEMAIPEAR